MRIPDKIRLGVTDWTVIVDDWLGADDDDWGQTSDALKLIKVKASLSPDARKDVFCHELLHVICCLAELDGGKRYTEEEFCNRLGPLLRMILEQNEDALFSK